MEPREAAVNCEAIKVSVRQDKNGINLVLAIHPQDAPEALLRSPVGTRYMVALVQIGDDEQPVAPQGVLDGNHAVTSAGLLCRLPKFQAWMRRKGYADMDNVDPEKNAADGLRRILGINSRSELRVDERARRLFVRLKREFEEER